jgi:hypothetical protein
MHIGGKQETHTQFSLVLRSPSLSVAVQLCNKIKQFVYRNDNRGQTGQRPSYEPGTVRPAAGRVSGFNSATGHGLEPLPFRAFRTRPYVIGPSAHNPPVPAVHPHTARLPSPGACMGLAQMTAIRRCTQHVRLSQAIFFFLQTKRHS